MAAPCVSATVHKLSYFALEKTHPDNLKLSDCSSGSVVWKPNISTPH